MTDGRRRTHAELPPEVRQLAQAILDRLDPAVRQAAARAEGGPARCEQVWCPVCALAALVTGERHPLLTVIAEHSVGLLAVVRAMLDAGGDAGGPTPPPPPPDGAPANPPGPGPGAPDPAAKTPGPGRYQHIPVVVEE